MEKGGKQLKLKEDIILEILKKGLMKNITEIKLAICDEKKFTKTLHDKIKEKDAIGDELYQARTNRKEKRVFNKKDNLF